MMSTQFLLLAGVGAIITTFKNISDGEDERMFAEMAAQAGFQLVAVGGLLCLEERHSPAQRTKHSARQKAISYQFCCTKYYEVNYSGSEFPTHFGYINGGKVGEQDQYNIADFMFTPAGLDAQGKLFFHRIGVVP